MRLRHVVIRECHSKDEALGFYDGVDFVNDSSIVATLLRPELNGGIWRVRLEITDFDLDILGIECIDCNTPYNPDDPDCC